MKLETFFQKFDLFADAPDAVSRMRELVLQLAFNGGLSGKRLTDSGVPDGWESRTIESISASITSGFACSKSHQIENGHVHLRTHNISTLGTLNFDLLVRINPEMVDPQKSSIRAGDILFNNTNSQELVGKTSLVDRDYDYGFSNHITRIRLKESIIPGYVVFYLTLLRNSGYFARLCTRWINQAAVNTDTLKEQTIPLPSLAEQKRIVAKVDELMALCDRLEAQQQERETRHAALARASLARFAEAPTVSNLQYLFHKSVSIPPADLRKAILTLAVQGKLVPQDPNDEPAEATLDAIARDRGATRSDKRMRSLKVAPIVESLPFDLPVSWSWTQLAYLGAAEDGALCDGPFGSKLKTEHYIGEKGYAVVRLGNIGEGYFIRGKEGYISKEHYESLPSNHTAIGDLLIAGLADPLVRCCEIPRDLGPAVNKSDCFRMRVHPLVERSYVRHFLNSPVAKSFAAEENHGITRERINLAGAKSLPIPLPPLAEQRRIVAKVEQLMALVDALEMQIVAYNATATQLLSAVVAELTGTKTNGKVSKPTAAGTGRRGRRRKS